MIKKIAAFFVLVCFMAQTFSQAAIVGSYYVNTAEYEKKCINKAKPKLHCNGKCQMMKQLKQEEKKDAQNPERSNTVKIDVLSSKSHFASLVIAEKRILICFSDHYIFFPAGTKRTIFHPPGAWFYFMHSI